ncbi:hypothetical protein WA158_002833 [Blastocystis sp. Blastoise]
MSFQILIASLFFALVVVAKIPYTEEEGRLWWNYAQITSDSVDSISNLSCERCPQFRGKLDNITNFYNIKSEIKGIISVYQNESIVIGFRGTKNVQNFIQDLGALVLGKMSGCEGKCQVAVGFYNAYLTVRDEIMSTVQNLGGALATVGSMDFQLNYNISTNLMYTYGCPYTGNKQFASILNQNLESNYRVTHNADPIPHLPPSVNNYAHPGDEIFYNEKNTAYKVCERPESKKCSNSVILPVNMNDHTSYYE